jgi:DNA-binding transcriptional MerR regulator
MFSIGDFAQLGRVSIRMLRHYDAIGLLTPAAVDPHSGYRFYTADQLRRLNRVIALKDLGFTLEQVRTIVDDKVDVAELRGMLRLRQAQLEAQMTADAAKLLGVAARLRMIETEGHMSTEDVILKDVAAMRVAELNAVAASYAPEHIGPVISPLYPELFMRLHTAGVTPAGPAIGYYDAYPAESDEAVIAHAAAPVGADVAALPGLNVLDLPAIPVAATLVHHGPMDDVMRSEQILARWIEDNGYRPLGYHREVYLDYDPANTKDGVTELQIAVAKE